MEVARVVGRDNTVSHNGRRLQLPASPLRAHYVKASVKIREYPDGTLAVFHGPRRIARYDVEGADVVPTAGILTCDRCPVGGRTLFRDRAPDRANTRDVCHQFVPEAGEDVSHE
jgi:hypothetical protein